MTTNNYNTSDESSAGNNAVASAFKTLAVATWIVGGLVAIIVGVIFESFIWFIITAFSTLLSGLVTYAFGEIIQRLHNIDHNTRNSTAVVVTEKVFEEPDEIPEL